MLPHITSLAGTRRRRVVADLPVTRGDIRWDRRSAETGNGVRLFPARVRRDRAEGTRNGVIGRAPPDVATRIPAESWEEDWWVMNLPGPMNTQHALARDYAFTVYHDRTSL